MRRGMKLRARPLVAGIALATGLGVAIGRLGWKRRERRRSMTEANKAVARRVIEEIFNEGRLTAADELVAPDFIGRDPASPEPLMGPEGLKRQAEGYRTAFPDMRLTIDDVIAEGDRVATRWSARGTHEGELFGIPATGKETTVTGITISRVVDGRLAESWISWDTFGLLQQLGVVPAMAQS